MPKDFHYDELCTLLAYHGFDTIKKGKTAGSRIKFEDSTGVVILLHKPHPNGILKQYQLKQIKEKLDL